ncbi:MAG: hypothetical protein R2939_20710 [Kofleriaceae bacterium]
MKLHVAPLLLALLGPGCAPDRDPALDRPRVVTGPIPLKAEVAYVDGALDRVVVVAADPGAPITTFAVGRRPRWATPTPDRARLLVITHGEERAEVGLADEPPTLWDVAVDGSRAPRAYPVGSPFDRLAISADGTLAIAHFSESGPDADGFFRNPNELAVIDLAAEDPEAAVTLRTLRSFGSAPSAVVLSPPMVLPGAADPLPRVFAFVLAEDRISIVDASHPDRAEITLRLDRAGTRVTPREVVFAPRTATAYVRSDGAADILEVLLLAEPVPDEAPLGNDFQAVLAELGAGAGPADIDVYDDADGRRFVLAASPSTRELVVIDADTAEFLRVPVPDPIDRIVLFPPGDATPTTAVLASIGPHAPRVHVLDLAGIDADLVPRAIETIAAGAPVMAVEPVPGRELALLVHDDDRTVLGLLDLAVGSISPLEGVARLDTYAFTVGGGFLVAGTANVARLGLLELDNLHPSDVPPRRRAGPSLLVAQRRALRRPRRPARARHRVAVAHRRRRPRGRPRRLPGHRPPRGALTCADRCCSLSR